jgi:hypothetical protein
VQYVWSSTALSEYFMQSFTCVWWHCLLLLLFVTVVERPLLLHFSIIHSRRRRKVVLFLLNFHGNTTISYLYYYVTVRTYIRYILVRTNSEVSGGRILLYVELKNYYKKYTTTIIDADLCAPIIRFAPSYHRLI